MKKTKFVAVAVATLMAVTTVGALAGCGGDSAHTISVMLLCNSRENKVYTDYFRNLEAELKEDGLNYSIDFTYQKSGDYYGALDTAINRNNIPDIFYVRPNELIKYKDHIVPLQDFADEQDFVDLGGIQKAALDMYRYNPTTGELGNENDDLYAFPKDLSTQQLGYNKTFLERYRAEFKAANIDLPWEGKFASDAQAKGTYTWDEFITICQMIHDSDTTEPNQYATDVPAIEIIAKSFGVDLIDLSKGKEQGTVVDLKSADMKKAIEVEAKLIAAGAYHGEDGYAAFTGNKMGFYSLVGSWEIAEHNDYAKQQNYEWGVMPWPTKDGSTNWQGSITSAGFVVSKNCAEDAENPEKAEIAKRIAISGLTPKSQNYFVREQLISLPLETGKEADYRDPANDGIYSPSTRGVFLDVVTGSHGFRPAKYNTYNDLWLQELETELTLMWNSKTPLTYFTDDVLTTLQDRMQKQYDEYKNR